MDRRFVYQGGTEHYSPDRAMALAKEDKIRDLQRQAKEIEDSRPLYGQAAMDWPPPSAVEAMNALYDEISRISRMTPLEYWEEWHNLEDDGDDPRKAAGYGSGPGPF